MNEVKQISSLQNTLVKKVILLKEKSRVRKKEGVFILEGQREIKLALKGAYTIETILFYEAIISETEVLKPIKNEAYQPHLISVSKEVYQKIAYRETTEGIVAIAKSKPHALEALTFKNDSPLLLVAEAPEKPGNIGALLRTAELKLLIF